ncbi:MAG: hypothetical protein ACD_37C00188G0002 [uncultured bacterium]|nr:MAG: hypothetical protein ACD_37C00188G0002 [uncultured bacterium]
MEKIVKKIDLISEKSFLRWQYLIVYFLIARLFFGDKYILLYSLFLSILFLRVKFEYGALIYFILAVIFYLQGRLVEANHYMSFMYGFLVFVLLRNIYFLLMKGVSKNKNKKNQ